MTERDDTESKRSERGRSSAVDRQDATGVEVPGGRKAAEVAPEEVQPARITKGGDERSAPREEERDERVVATAHAEATPAEEERGVRSIGNTDVPVNARDPDAP